MVGPWLFSLWKRGRRLSDIEYLSIKEFDGKLVKNDGVLSATGDLATLTASAGKDMYLAKAKVNVEGGGSGGSCTITLNINGTVVETYEVKFAAISSAQALVNKSSHYEYINIGQKVAATQIIKLEVTQESSIDNIHGSIVCFEEATGDSPAI